MITIENVDNNPRETGPHKYLLRVNREDICTFTHDPEMSLADCLLAAVKALPEEIKPGVNICFPNRLLDSDEDKVMAEVGDHGVITGTYEDGYLVKNLRNELEFFALRVEFCVFRKQ